MTSIATKLPLKLEGPHYPSKYPSQCLGTLKLEGRGVSQNLPLITSLTNHYFSHSSKTREKFKITTISKYKIRLRWAFIIYII